MPLSNPSVSKPIKSTIANPTTVVASVVSVSILVANPLRVGAIICNISASDLYLDFDAEATTSSFAVKIAADGGYYELPFGYLGAISGVWEVADGSAMVRELV